MPFSLQQLALSRVIFVAIMNFLFSDSSKSHGGAILFWALIKANFDCSVLILHSVLMCVCHEQKKKNNEFFHVHKAKSTK